jgi:hypothetical protein
MELKEEEKTDPEKEIHKASVLPLVILLKIIKNLRYFFQFNIQNAHRLL